MVTEKTSRPDWIVTNPCRAEGKQELDQPLLVVTHRVIGIRHPALRQADEFEITCLNTRIPISKSR